MTAMLVVYGVGLAVGNWLSGRLAERLVDGASIGSLVALVVLLRVFAYGMRHASAALLIFLWGVASFALVPPLQMWVMAEASEAPDLASAMNIGAFNLGNAVGAALGGWDIAAGFGFPAVSLAGAATSAAGLLPLFVLPRGRQPSTAAASG